MRIGLCLLLYLYALVGVNAAQKACLKGSLCYCKSHIGQMAGDEAEMCDQLAHETEAANLKNGKACNEKSCIYRMKPNSAQSEKGPWTFVGYGMKLTIKDKDGSSFRATLVDDRKRTFIFDRDCPEGPCDAYYFVSGPDKRARLSDGNHDRDGSQTYIVELPK